MRILCAVIAGCVLALGLGCKKTEPSPAPHPDDGPKEMKRQPREKPVIINDVPSRPAGTTLTIHRRGAGEPDEDGWCLAESSEGGFSVKVPTLFNDATASYTAQSGRVVKMYYLTAQTERGTVYSVGAVTGVEGGVPTAESQFERTIAEYKSEITEKRYMNHAGMKGLHIKISHPDEATFLRLYRSGPTLYTLSVAHTPGPVMPIGVEIDAIHFLDSFRVK